MAPKTEFSIPLQKTIDVVTHSRRSNREVRTTEKVVPQHHFKKTSLPSESQQKVGKDEMAAEAPLKGQQVGQPSNEIIETYPLHITETHEDAEDMGNRNASDEQHNVKIIIPPHVYISDSFTGTNGSMAAVAS